MRKTKIELAKQLVKLRHENRKLAVCLAEKFSRTELETMVKAETYKRKTEAIICIQEVLLSNGAIYEYVAFTAEGKRYYQATATPKHIIRFMEENPNRVRR